MLVSKEIADKLKTNTLYNTVALHSPDGSFEDITGESIVLDSFSLENEIVEKELKFGGCIASEMSVKLIDYDCSALIGKAVQVIITATYLESELYPSDDLYPSNTLICPAETGTVECPVFYGKIQSAQRDKNSVTSSKSQPMTLFMICQRWICLCGLQAKRTRTAVLLMVMRTIKKTIILRAFIQ